MGETNVAITKVNVAVRNVTSKQGGQAMVYVSGSVSVGTGTKAKVTRHSVAGRRSGATRYPVVVGGGRRYSSVRTHTSNVCNGRIFVTVMAQQNPASGRV